MTIVNTIIEVLGDFIRVATEWKPNSFLGKP
jgi:hypothetical protein